MDRGQKETEKLLKEIEKRINAEYSQAQAQIEAELQDYLRRYEIKDETWRKWVKEGKKTQKEYQQWRMGQLAVGQRWADQREAIARDLYAASEVAKSIVQGYKPEIYAVNHNFATYQIEHDARIDTSYTLYSRESVERLIRDNPDVLPNPGRKVKKAIAEGKAVRWNKQMLQSVMIQGIVQGDSIPKLATRLAETVGDKDRKASIRNARTAATAAQNAGRLDAYKRAQSKGVDVEKQWIATLDGRTRHSHRELDGEIRPLDEEFSNGCSEPGDPHGDPSEIYNCRCSMKGVVKGLKSAVGDYRKDAKIDGMSYDEWKKAKPKSNSITLPEEKAEAIRQSYLAEYRRSGKINKESLNKDVLSRARSISTIEDARTVSSSSVLGMETYDDMVSYFATNYGITLEGFEGKKIFDISVTLAGYDDMLKEFPEAVGIIRRIQYDSTLKDCGNWDSLFTSKVGSAGLRDYGTGVHEMAHVVDYARGRDYSHSEAVIAQAKKNLGYRANGKDYKDEWTRICGMPRGIKQPDSEKFAYAIETAKGGGSSRLAQEVYRLAKENK